MSVAEGVKDATRLWIDRLNNGTGLEGAWRLQRIDRRSRKIEGDEDSIEERPARIRRFAKGIPANWIDEAVKYLISLAPYTDIVFNGTKLEGTYAPTRTWWERDEGATVDRGQMRENTYTLYQDLVDWENADSTDFDAGGSCSETIHMRYEYDTFSIEDVPSGGQGVTTSIQAVSRNEDGTFNYAVVTRKAKTAIGTEQVIKCDEYQTVSQQVYQNLYGVEGAYKDESEKDVSLPHPCDDRRTGLLVELTTRKNDDCTYDVTVTTTKSKNVSPAEHTKQKTLRGVTETTVSRNVLDDSVEVSDIGDRVQVERNPDGTYNRSSTHVVKEDVGDIGSSCQQTVFEHSHVTNENVATRPDEEADQAGDGKTYQVQARITEEGTWDVTRTTTTELAQTYAQHTKQKTLRGVIETYVDRNVDNNDVTVTNIGDRVQIEMTPGGKYNRTITTVTPEPVGIIAQACSISSVAHTDTQISNVPDGKQPDPYHQDGQPNVDVSIEVRRTEEGTWDVTERKTEFLGVDKPDLFTVPNHGVTDTHSIHRNAQSINVGTVPQKHRKTVTAQLNDHGTYDYHVVDSEAQPQDSDWVTWNSEQKMPTYTYEWEHGVRVFTNQTIEWVSNLRSGLNKKDATVSISLNSFGLVDGTVSYRKLIKWSLSGGDDPGGGISTGAITVYRKDGTSDTYETRAYSGTGNEGMERGDKVNQIIIEGVQLPSRTYIIGLNPSAPQPSK